MRGVDLIPGNAGGAIAREGSTVRVLLKGRLFAKQGWIFTNDYAEVDGEEPNPCGRGFGDSLVYPSDLYLIHYTDRLYVSFHDDDVAF